MSSAVQQLQLKQLCDLSAATVYGAQGAKAALDSGMTPIDPTMRLTSPALTADCRPADNLMLHCAVQKAHPGDVLVLDSKGFMEAGLWGDVLTLQAMARRKRQASADPLSKKHLPSISRVWAIHCAALV